LVLAGTTLSVASTAGVVVAEVPVGTDTRGILGYLPERDLALVSTARSPAEAIRLSSRETVRDLAPQVAHVVGNGPGDRLAVLVRTAQGGGEATWEASCFSVDAAGVVAPLGGTVAVGTGALVPSTVTLQGQRLALVLGNVGEGTVSLLVTECGTGATRTIATEPALTAALHTGAADTVVLSVTTAEGRQLHAHDLRDGRRLATRVGFLLNGEGDLVLVRDDDGTARSWRPWLTPEAGDPWPQVNGLPPERGFVFAGYVVLVAGAVAQVHVRETREVVFTTPALHASPASIDRVALSGDGSTLVAHAVTGLGVGTQDLGVTVAGRDGCSLVFPAARWHREGVVAGTTGGGETGLYALREAGVVKVRGLEPGDPLVSATLVLPGVQARVGD
jgi:hypothetical protein